MRERQEWQSLLMAAMRRRTIATGLTRHAMEGEGVLGAHLTAKRTADRRKGIDYDL